MAEWLFVLTPPRQTFVDDMTDEESKIMRAHFAYLQRLLADGTLVLAGPSLGPVFGFGVFEAETEKRARAIVAADPAVSSGLQSVELSRFRVSLLRGRD
jgi:uncharacterized protein YciI